MIVYVEKEVLYPHYSLSNEKNLGLKIDLPDDFVKEYEATISRLAQMSGEIDRQYKKFLIQDDEND